MPVHFVSKTKFCVNFSNVGIRDFFTKTEYSINMPQFCKSAVPSKELTEIYRLLIQNLRNLTVLGEDVENSKICFTEWLREKVQITLSKKINCQNKYINWIKILKHSLF